MTQREPEDPINVSTTFEVHVASLSYPPFPNSSLNMSSNIKPLVLHAHGSGPNPYKCAMALELVNVPYEVKLWQFGDAPNGVKGPEFLKINENGRVPAYVSIIHHSLLNM